MNWHHVGIHVTDLEKSIAFYESIFGFEVETRFEYDGESIVFLQKGHVRIELIKTEDQIMGEDRIHISWQVDNIHQWVESLGEKQVFPVDGPLFLDNGWQTVFFQGPDYEVIELIQLDNGLRSSDISTQTY